MDPTRLLNQFLGQMGGAAPHAANQDQRQGQQPTQGSGFDLSSLASGAALGGVAGFLLNSRGARRTGRNIMRTGRDVAPLAGLAAVGGLAYMAFRTYKNKQAGGATQEPAAPATLAPPPADSGFAPEAQPGGEANLALLILRAMIAAAKADGHIDAEEQARIFDRLDQSDITAEEKAFLFDEMQNPATIAELAEAAVTPELALEIYAASVLAIEADTAEEQTYLQELAMRLNIEPALAQEVRNAAAEL